MEKMLKKLLLFVVIVILPGFICMFLRLGGVASKEYYCFALDKNDVLYLGKNGVIEKYYEDEMIGTINPKTSRGYYFTICNGDEILLSTGSDVYIMDLEENLLKQREESTNKTYIELQFSRNSFTSVSGNKYYMSNHWGRMVIKSESGEFIYKMPLIDYVVRLVLIYSFLGMGIGIPIYIYKIRKEYFMKKTL